MKVYRSRGGWGGRGGSEGVGRGGRPPARLSKTWKKTRFPNVQFFAYPRARVYVRPPVRRRRFFPRPEKFKLQSYHVRRQEALNLEASIFGVRKFRSEYCSRAFSSAFSGFFEASSLVQATKLRPLIAISYRRFNPPEVKTTLGST